MKGQTTLSLRISGVNYYTPGTNYKKVNYKLTVKLAKL